jgi:uncharacterized membrane protein
MIGKWLATAVVNGLLFLVSAALAVSLAYQLTNSAALLLLILNVAFAAAGALTRAWSQHRSAVAFPAGLVSIVIVTLLSMEAYLGDGGDPSTMWRYIPGAVGFFAALATVGSANGGWVLLGKLRNASSGRA